MKKHKVLFLFFVSFFSNGIIAQINTIPNSFEIHQNTMVSLEDFYINSIQKANLETYRLKDKRVSLIFENGFIMELLSAKELLVANNSIVLSLYESEFPKSYVLPTFKILPSGELVAVYLKVNKG